MKKVAHLSSAHPANDTRIFHKECKSLAAAGFDVALIAVADEDRVVDGVRVRAFNRIRQGSHLTRIFRIWKEMWRAARAEHADLYHIHDPELLPLALLLKLRGSRVIFDAHELAVEQIRRIHWIPEQLRPSLARLFAWTQAQIGRRLDGVVLAWPAIAEAFPGSNTVNVRNFPQLSENPTDSAGDYGARGWNVTYVGGMTEIRGILEMVRAVDLVRQKRPVRLLLGGKFSPNEFERRVKAEEGWRNVEELGWLGRDEVVEAYRQSRAGLLLFDPDVPNHRRSEPNKLFEYMLAGLPVICTDIPYYRQFVEDIGSGIMVDARDPEQTANAIEWIFDHPEEAAAMGKRGREAVLRQFTWEVEADKLVAMYQEVLSSQ